MARASSRETILDAARRLLLRQGYARFSLDALAAEAGVSKGGLFYHFDGKAALLLALVERHDADYEKKLRACAAEFPEGPGRLARAFVRSKVEAGPNPGNFSPVNALSAMEEPRVMAAVAERKRRLFERMTADGLPPETAVLVQLAADGLWMTECAQGLSLAGAARRKVADELYRLIDEAVGRRRRESRRLARESARRGEEGTARASRRGRAAP